MAVDTGTIQTLAFLNKLVDQGAQAREADKNRAMRVLELKVSTDQQRAARLDRQMASLQSEVTELEKAAATTVGTIGSAPDNTRSDLKRIASSSLDTTLGEIEGMRDRIGSLQNRKSEIMNTLRLYGQAYNQLADPLYEKYREADKDASLYGRATISDKEFKMVLDDLQKQAGGAQLSDAGKAGLLKKFRELQGGTAEVLAKDEMLAMQRIKFAAERKKAANEGKSKKYIDMYQQAKDHLEKMKGASEDLQGLELSLPSDISRSAEDVREAMYSSAISFAKYVGKMEESEWWSNLPENTKKVFDDFNRAAKAGDRQGMILNAMSLAARHEAGEWSIGANLDTDFGWGQNDPTNIEYGLGLLSMINSLRQFNNEQLFEEGVQDDPFFRAVMGATYDTFLPINPATGQPDKEPQSDVIDPNNAGGYQFPGGGWGMMSWMAKSGGKLTKFIGEKIGAVQWGANEDIRAFLGGGDHYDYSQPKAQFYAEDEVAGIDAMTGADRKDSLGELTLLADLADKKKSKGGSNAVIDFLNNELRRAQGRGWQYHQQKQALNETYGLLQQLTRGDMQRYAKLLDMSEKGMHSDSSYIKLTRQLGRDKLLKISRLIELREFTTGDKSIGGLRGVDLIQNTWTP